MTSVVEKIVSSLVPARLASISEIRGCTLDEVQELERLEGVQLPQAYKDYLLKMGKGAGRFLEGTDAFYRHLPRLRKWAQESLSESNSSFKLTKSFFVFASHQGYEFLLLELRENDQDPPVWICHEGDQQPVRKWPTFSAYLENVFDQTVRLNQT